MNTAVAITGAISALVGAATAILALVFAHRTVKVSRDQLRMTERRQVVDVFKSAVDLLATSNVDTRAGGVQLLEQIMHESPESRSAAVKKLATFIRTQTAGSIATSYRSGKSDGQKEPAADVYAALVAIGRRPHAGRPEVEEIDLAGVNLAGVGIPFRTKTSYAILLSPGSAQDDFSHATFSGAKLRGARFIAVELNWADLAGSDLTSVDFWNVRLNHSSLVKANLSGANLGGSYLRGANLTMANLTGANLTGVDLRDARLCHANLTNTEFAKDIPAELAGADLSNAILAGANLKGVDLSETIGLLASQLANAVTDGQTVSPTTRINA